MRPPARRPEQLPPDMPAQSFREGDASRTDRSLLGKKAGFKTLAPFLVARKASHIEVIVSSFRFSDQATPRTSTTRSSPGRPRRLRGVQ